MTPGKRGECRLELPSGVSVEIAHTQLHRRAPQGADFELEPHRIFKDLLTAPRDHFSRACEDETPAASLGKRRTEFLLKRLHLLGNGRLRYIALVCRLVKAVRVRDRTEVLELT